MAASKLLSDLRILSVLIKFIGIFPYSYRLSKTRSVYSSFNYRVQDKLKFCWVYFLYSLSILLCTSSSVLITWKDYLNPIPQRWLGSTTMKSIVIINDVSYALIGVFINIYCLYKSKHLFSIIKLIEKQNQALEITSKEFYKDYYKTFFVLFYSVIICLEASLVVSNDRKNFFVISVDMLPIITRSFISLFLLVLFTSITESMCKLYLRVFSGIFTKYNKSHLKITNKSKNKELNNQPSDVTIQMNPNELNIKLIKLQIFNLIEIKRKVYKYYGIIIVLLLIVFVERCILSLFYIVFIIRTPLDIKMTTMFAIFISSSYIPLTIIFNTPMPLINMVSTIVTIITIVIIFINNSYVFE